MGQFVRQVTFKNGLAEYPIEVGQVDSDSMTDTGIINGTYGGYGYTTSHNIDRAGRALQIQQFPVGALTSLFANLPAPTSVQKGTLYYLLDQNQGRVINNGTRWVDISGGDANVLDFGADPTGATDSYPAFQAALNALAVIGGGTLIIPAPPALSNFYTLSQTLVRQPVGNRLNCTINIKSQCFSNQIKWRGAPYTPALLSMGMYDCDVIGFSVQNDQAIEGFICCDHRTDYWHAGQTQLQYIHCNHVLGSAKNCVGFRTANGPGNLGGGGQISSGTSLDHGWLWHCNVQSGSTATKETGNIAFMIGGVNTIPFRMDHTAVTGAWVEGYTGGVTTFPTQPFFTSQQNTLGVLNCTGFYPGSSTKPGYLLISKSNQSSPFELASYTGISGINPPSSNTTTGSIAAPAAPGLSKGTGTWTAATAWVAVTLVDSHGETLASSISSISVGTNESLVVTAPASSGDATGWYLYVATGTYFPQIYQLFRQGGLNPFITPVTLSTNPTAASFTGVVRGLNGTTPLNAVGGVTITQWSTDTLVTGTVVSDIANDATSITLVDASLLPSSGTIQINSGPTSANVLNPANGIASYGGIGASCVPYETITYTGKSSNTLTGCSRGQLGSTADSYPFVLPIPFAPTLSTGSGTWTAQTAWVQVTYKNTNGETIPSAITSISIGASSSLTITAPDATGWTVNSPATGWNLYVGTGATKPANSAMYLQGGVNPFGTPVTISSNPTTGGANPPITNTAAGGNGFAVFQRLYGPSPGAIAPAGVDTFINPSSFGCSNNYIFNSVPTVTIIGGNSQGLRGQYLTVGQVGSGLGGNFASVSILSPQIFSASPNPPSQNLFYFANPTTLRILGGEILGNNDMLFTTNMLTCQRPCNIRMDGVGISSTDPFLGDPSLQSDFSVTGCIPLTTNGSVSTLGAFFSSPAPSTNFANDTAAINILSSDHALTFLLLTTAVGNSRSIAFTARRPGEIFRLMISQPLTGGTYNLGVTWTNTITWAGNVAATINQGAGALTVIEFMPYQIVSGGSVNSLVGRQII